MSDTLEKMKSEYLRNLLCVSKFTASTFIYIYMCVCVCVYWQGIPFSFRTWEQNCHLHQLRREIRDERTKDEWHVDWFDQQHMDESQLLAHSCIDDACSMHANNSMAREGDVRAFCADGRVKDSALSQPRNLLALWQNTLGELSLYKCTPSLYCYNRMWVGRIFLTVCNYNTRMYPEVSWQNR
jgi:hypothetical protein